VFGGTSSLSYFPNVRGCRSGCGPQFWNGQAASDAILNVTSTTLNTPKYSNQQNNATIVSGIAFKAGRDGPSPCRSFGLDRRGQLISCSLLFVPQGWCWAQPETRKGLTEVLYESLGIVELRAGPKRFGRGCQFDHVQLKFSRHVFDNLRLNRPLMFHVSVNQRVLAQKIDHTRHTQGIQVHCVRGCGAENVRLPGSGSADLQPLENVIMRLFFG